MIGESTILNGGLSKIFRAPSGALLFDKLKVSCANRILKKSLWRLRAPFFV